MDTIRVAEIRRRMAYETQRTEAPEGFPRLPDLPLGRYTDDDMYALELEKVFKRSWLFAPHETELSRRGAIASSTYRWPRCWWSGAMTAACARS